MPGWQHNSKCKWGGQGGKCVQGGGLIVKRGSVRMMVVGRVERSTGQREQLGPSGRTTVLNGPMKNGLAFLLLFFHPFHHSSVASVSLLLLPTTADRLHIPAEWPALPCSPAKGCHAAGITNLCTCLGGCAAASRGQQPRHQGHKLLRGRQ